MESWVGPVYLVIFFLLGGTSSILRTFWGRTSQMKHPVLQELGICAAFDCLIHCARQAPKWLFSPFYLLTEKRNEQTSSLKRLLDVEMELFRTN